MTAAMGLVRQGRRFAIVGVLNSLVGYAVILAALVAGASDYLANALGYAVGLGLGFLLHRDWAFAATDREQRPMRLRYLLAFAMAYSVNLAVVALARRVGLVDLPVTHIAAMACYSLSFFLLARYYVFPSNNQKRLRVPSFLSARGLIAIGSLAAGGVYFMVVFVNPTTHDVAWQLWIGDRLHGGSRLYVDIMEINPPLWFWMAQALSAIADGLRLDSRPVLIAAVILWSAVAARLTFRLSSDIPGTRLFVAFLCAAVATYSFRYFGQREHLALLAAIPYAALIARRRSGEAVGLHLAIAVGLLGGAGFALKHYFVAIPVLLELWLAARLIGQGRYRWLRPETITLGVCALGYAAAVVFLTPEFLTTIVPMVGLAYYSYEVDWFTAVARPQLIFSMIAVILAVSIARRDTSSDERLGKRRSDIVMALALTSAGFAVSFILQKKGWPYHGLPMTLAAFAALAAAFTLSERPFHRLKSYPLAAALFLFLVYSGTMSGGYTNPVRETVEGMIAAVPADEPIAALGSDPMIAWPMVTEKDHPWPLRHYALWMLRALLENEARPHPDPDLLLLGERIRRETATDLACRPPRMILVDDAAARLGLATGSFDILDWLNRDARFAEVFSRYRLVGSGDFGIRAFAIAGPLKAESLPDCRRLT